MRKGALFSILISVSTTAGCTHIYSGNALPTQPDAATTATVKKHSFWQVDQGHGVVLTKSGRSVLSSWNGGPKRDQLILCAEPPIEFGQSIWQRYELCVQYLNGLMERETYQQKLQALMTVKEDS